MGLLDYTPEGLIITPVWLKSQTLHLMDPSLIGNFEHVSSDSTVVRDLIARLCPVGGDELVLESEMWM